MKTITKVPTEDLRLSLLSIANQVGHRKAASYVGGYQRYVDIVYGGDIKNFSDVTNTKIRISDNGMTMYFPDALVELLGFKVIPYSKNKEKELGKFKYKSSGMYFAFNARLMKVTFIDRVEWKVVGTSGSYGFGYGFFTKKETMGIRARTQIFRDIVEKLDLVPFMNI